MGTVVAIETDSGVAIAGDRRTTRGETVTGDSTQRVFAIRDVGVGAIADTGAIDTFRRRFESALRRARREQAAGLTAEVVARVAAGAAQRTGVEAVVASPDAHLRQVTPEGAALDEPRVALGTGAELAFGRLDGLDDTAPLETTTTALEDIIAAVAERDPATGERVDTYSRARTDTSQDG